MLLRIILSVAGIGFLSTALPFMVRQSRLELNSDGVHFPTVSGSNLARQEFEFPRDFAGEINLLFVPFLQQQQFTVNTWVPFAQELESNFPGLVYYELPTIDEMPMISRTFINEGMRAGIQDAKARQRTITLYIDTEKFRDALNIPSKNQVHILLVNRTGDILWRTTGNYNEAKGNELKRIVEMRLR